MQDDKEEIVIREPGKAYWFSDKTVKRYEAGLLVFKDKTGKFLRPKYFGSGLTGFNGTLELVKPDAGIQ